MTPIRTASQLGTEEIAAVLRLVRQATDEDGVAPLSEHVMLHLRYGGDRQARNFWICRDDEVAAYAHLDPTDPVEGPSAELVVHPAYRRQHLALALLGALREAAGAEAVTAGSGAPGSGAPGSGAGGDGAGGDGPEGASGTGQLRLWAHGDLPAASRLAEVAGFKRIRGLWQMRRSLQTRLDRPEFAGGVALRTFRVGQDEDAWVALNARAFARHPEQGAWTRTDLDLREAEPWFDPEGFLLAERDGRLLGFHWTKIHGRDGQERAHSHEAIGEVYVVGVDPAERGTGLGRALTLAGLRYLRSRGLFQVMLYVDEGNAAAIRLYESLGFTHWDTDVMFGLRALASGGNTPGRALAPAGFRSGTGQLRHGLARHERAAGAASVPAALRGDIQLWLAPDPLPPAPLQPCTRPLLTPSAASSSAAVSGRSDAATAPSTSE